MLTRVVCALFVIVIFFEPALYAAEDWYYFGDQEITLNVSPSEVVVKPKDVHNLNWNDVFNDYDALAPDFIPKMINDGFYRLGLREGHIPDVIIGQLKNDSRFIFANPVFLDDFGRNIYVTSRVYVEFLPEHADLIDDLLSQYDLNELYSFSSNSLHKLIELKDGRNFGPVSLSVAIYESGVAAISMPDFTLPIEPLMTPNDQYYPDQYHLDSLDMPLVWDLYIPETPVLVAVLDGGFEPHEDINPARWAGGADYVYYPGPPTPPDTCDYCPHGMAVTGIIVASTDNDSIGVAAIAGRNGIRILQQQIWYWFHSWEGTYSASEAMIRRAIENAVDSGALVINNSWGVWLATNPHYLDYKIREGLYYAYENGVLVVCGSGNNCGLTPGACNEMLFPASHTTTFAVGALNKQDAILSTSQGSPDLDVAGYGEDVVTTDRMGANGFSYKKGSGPSTGPNYYGGFGGTSAAAAQVTATAALILQRRPDLQRDLQTIEEILRYSCENPYSPGEEDTTRIDNRIGWGRVNTFRALLAVSRGDANNDGNVNCGDIAYLTNFIYHGGPAPQPHLLMGDANCDGRVNLGDLYYLINYVYHAGPAPQICFEY